jgi:hypothetical protein
MTPAQGWMTDGASNYWIPIIELPATNIPGPLTRFGHFESVEHLDKIVQQYFAKAKNVTSG